MLPYISPEETRRRLDKGEIRLVDIRDVAEFGEVSIEGALLAPLPVVDRQPFKEEGAAEKPVVFTCRSGRRTEGASDLLQKLAPEAYQLKGGINAWEQAGLPVRRHAKAPIPLMRQIQIGAGSVVLLGTLGSFVWPPLFWLAVFAGAGLVFAGTTGFCALGIALSKMPWNKVQ